MKIISKFKDYYDTALSHGMDESLHYVRKTEVLSDGRETNEFRSAIVKLFKSPPYRKIYFGGDNDSFNPIIIFFCGKTYLTYHYTKYFQHTDKVPVDEDYLISLEQVISKSSTEIKEKTKSKSWSNLFNTSDFTQENILKSMEEINGKKHPLNADLKTPIITATLISKRYLSYRNDEIKIVLNPVLKDINFMRHVDPYTAYQELSMFMGGVIGQPDKPMIEVSEKVKVASKGFDVKWSFRKKPTKRKIK